MSRTLAAADIVVSLHAYGGIITMFVSTNGVSSACQGIIFC